MTTIAEQVEEGSSPLARGLLRCSAWHFCARRIIPARAGFTATVRSPSRSKPDHPRSRGVYLVAAQVDELLAGSSPLARGLPDTPTNPRDNARIIPARAGFTRAVVLPHCPFPDHPRSRGVYQLIGCPQMAQGGSSPLARGLLPDCVGVGLDVRIIPARAGFTSIVYWAKQYGGDHPRSRGVYPDRCHGLLRFLGSSPLARGLLLGEAVRGFRNRIIPARAGFTCTAYHAYRPSWDHPRSRGVYRWT